MERRAFLSLIATAPIAALGPWEKLIQPQLAMRADAFAMMFDNLAPPVRVDILSGYGYIRRTVDDSGNLVIDSIPS